MLKESKYCCNVIKKHFNKDFVMTEKDHQDFEDSTKCWIYDNDYVDGDVKGSDHFHITGKYRGSAHTDCNITVKLNHKASIAFNSLKNYDSHFILEELGKFDFKINFIPNALEKHIRFNTNNTLNFIAIFQSSSPKNLGKDDFKYLSQEFDSKGIRFSLEKRILSV